MNQAEGWGARVSVLKAVEKSDCRSLTQLHAGGALGASQALHYALLAAEALRQMHDAGRTHGAISAEAFTIAGPAVQLQPASSSDVPHDPRADIFAFGGVLAELLAGVAGADRVVRKCLAQDPAARFERIQQAIVELKLLIVADRLRRLRGIADRLESMAACLTGIVSRLDERRQDERTESYWFPGRSGRGWRAARPGETSTVQNECRRH